MLKKIVDNTITGMGISFLMTNTMFFIFARETQGSNIINAYILWMIAGAFFGLISLIYDYEKLNKKVACIIHFLSVITVTFVTIEIMFRSVFHLDHKPSYLFLLLIFITIYFATSICAHLYEKISINELNKKLKRDTH